MVLFWKHPIEQTEVSLVRLFFYVLSLSQVYDWFLLQKRPLPSCIRTCSPSSTSLPKSFCLELSDWAGMSNSGEAAPNDDLFQSSHQQRCSTYALEITAAVFWDCDFVKPNGIACSSTVSVRIIICMDNNYLAYLKAANMHTLGLCCFRSYPEVWESKLHSNITSSTNWPWSQDFTYYCSVFKWQPQYLRCTLQAVQWL